MHSQSKQQLIPLYLIIFIGFFGYALTIALFIPMLLDKGYDLLSAATSTATRTTISGFLLGMYPLGQFIGSPIIGKLSDHYGRKKILLTSMVLCIIGFISIGISIEIHNVILLFISCFFTGLCESNMAIAQAVISDLSQNNLEKTKLIAYAFSACSLGYVCGPLFGGLSASSHDYYLPFYLTAVSILPLLIWIKSSMKETKHITLKIKLNIFESITSMRTIFTNKKLRLIYLVNFIIFFAIQGLYRVAPMYIVDTWNPSLHTYTTIISFVSLICLLANIFLTGRLSKKFKAKNLLIALLAFSAIFTLSIVTPKNFNWIWLTYGLAAIPTIIALTTTTTWLSNQASDNEQGQVLGNNQALLVLGEALSAGAGGLIAAINISLPIIVMACLLLLAVLVISTKKS